ncbi:hypothetical protein MUN74_15325 [Agromyces endophyticus]|uniref:hypothetical protein n=1 Tax=Agromyces sp. H17E-10 TaxID=2932244 RepID=UPI001FD0578B|nr:hypothetical protein [Agromyces sp. H17E-10]UOQ88626.1 hypothetical protein MUN74_15325 [Agromyces sp. H17E-10]
MSIAAAFAAGHLAARAADRRFGTTESEVRAAEQRVAARRAALVAADATARVAPAKRDLTERGRHVAPRPA